MSRDGRALWALAAVGACVACSTFVADSGRELADAQAVTVSCSARNLLIAMSGCQITAIDGQRPSLGELFNWSGKLAPGRHWIEIELSQFFGGGGGTTDVCALEADFGAGRHYVILSQSATFDIGWAAKHSGALYTGSVLLTSGAAGAEQEDRVRMTCSFGGGSLCRRDVDCVPHPDIRCMAQPGMDFGACRFK